MLEGKTDTWACPDWYPLIAAARYLGVAPWELMEQSIWWQEKALIAQSAEAGALKIRKEHGL